MIGKEDIARIQEQLGRLAVDAVEIDLDGFLEVSEMAASPQALSAGLDPQVVTSAALWAEMALLLKPFRDIAVARTAALREELADGDLVVEWAACPGCGERRVDELAIGQDDSVVCSTCSRRYFPKGREADS